MLAFAMTVAIQCAPHDRVVKRLEEKFGEHQESIGMQGPTQVFELWASDETGSWTILMTSPDGMTCVMASGTDWYRAVHVAAGEDA